MIRKEDVADVIAHPDIMRPKTIVSILNSKFEGKHQFDVNNAVWYGGFNDRLLERMNSLECLRDLDLTVKGDKDALKEQGMRMYEKYYEAIKDSGVISYAYAYRARKIGISINGAKKIGEYLGVEPHLFRPEFGRLAFYLEGLK